MDKLAPWIWDEGQEQAKWDALNVRIDAEFDELALFIDWLHTKWSDFFEEDGLRMMEAKKGEEEAYFESHGDVCCWIKDGDLVTNDGSFAFPLLWMEYKKMI